MIQNIQKSPARIKRLCADWESMKQLTSSYPLIEVQPFGNFPDKYVVTYRCKGLIKLAGTLQPSLTRFHQMEIYLHDNYPRLQPRLMWLTEIFHPNILSYSRNGGICIGKWSAAETLAQLCTRIAEMIQFELYNTKDFLDEEAALWVEANKAYLPIR